jgi:hypothetical protein
VLTRYAETQEPIWRIVMRLALTALLATVGLSVVLAPAARADVFDCGGAQPQGVLTCITTGPAMINGNSFVGDGGSSAQLQWRGTTTAAAPGTLQLGYTYTGVFNSLFAKISLRLTISQPTCEEPHDSERNWVDLSSADGVRQQISVHVSCAGPVDYTITSRAATYSLGGSFVGQLDLSTPTFSLSAS